MFLKERQMADRSLRRERERFEVSYLVELFKAISDQFAKKKPLQRRSH